MNLCFWTVKFWKDVGYGLASSHYLSKRLIHTVDIAHMSSIVELGAGHGEVTKYILAEKGKDSKFITLENDLDRYEAVKIEYGQSCEVSNLDADKISEIIPSNSVDVVFSTLPLGSIDEKKVDTILASIESILKPGGYYIQYQYWMWNRSQIKKYFHIEKTLWEPRNIGPAFIYVARKEK